MQVVADGLELRVGESIEYHVPRSSGSLQSSP
jgi:hypothetical protein